MESTQQFVILGVGLVLLIALMFWPQWQARRRQQQQMSQLKPGIDIITVGGIVGKLTAVDPEQNRVMVEVSPGVEIQFLTGAISRTQAPVEAEPEEGGDLEPEAPIGDLEEETAPPDLSQA